MIVVVSALDGSARFTVVGVERIEEFEEAGHPDDGKIVLVTDHSKNIVLDHYTQTLDIVGLG